MAYAARVMRGLIIDDVRRRRSEKRGGLFEITSLGIDHADRVTDPQSLIMISDALDELAEVEPGLAEIVDLKFFCGFSFAEIAAMRGVSERTIQRNWEKGRLYLHHAIGSGSPAPVDRQCRRISPERWRVLSPYLDEALEIEAAEQAAWLASISARDPALADDLRSMLAGAQGRPRLGLPRGRRSLDPRLTLVPSLAGQVLGAYRLLSPIGQGGTGSVWLAERCDGRFEGRAAVKLLNIALVGRAGEERFRREGTILARLRHPHIAHLIDAGVSPTGQPYLVLEHVDGQPIDRYCDERALAIEARLRLFLDVLDAVAHAHANLIVHRDIKPANVLVSKDGQRQAARLRHRQADRARCATAVERRGVERAHARRRLGADAGVRGARAALGRRRSRPRPTSTRSACCSTCCSAAGIPRAMRSTRRRSCCGRSSRRRRRSCRMRSGPVSIHELLARRAAQCATTPAQLRRTLARRPRQRSSPRRFRRIPPSAMPRSTRSPTTSAATCATSRSPRGPTRSRIGPHGSSGGIRAV